MMPITFSPYPSAFSGQPARFGGGVQFGEGTDKPKPTGAKDGNETPKADAPAKKTWWQTLKSVPYTALLLALSFGALAVPTLFGLSGFILPLVATVTVGVGLEYVKGHVRDFAEKKAGVEDLSRTEYTPNGLNCPEDALKGLLSFVTSKVRWALGVVSKWIPGFANEEGRQQWVSEWTDYYEKSWIHQSINNYGQNWLKGAKDLDSRAGVNAINEIRSKDGLVAAGFAIVALAFRKALSSPTARTAIQTKLLGGIGKWPLIGTVIGFLVTQFLSNADWMVEKIDNRFGFKRHEEALKAANPQPADDAPKDKAPPPDGTPPPA